MIRMFRHILPNRSGDSQTDIRVDIDLAHRHAGGLAELILRNADCAGHIAAVLVDDLHELLGYRGRTVENDGEPRQTLGDFFQDVKSQLGLGAGFKLVGSLLG